jgi:anti-sigma regulatory factor (Ser/Thr protein kinase)
MATITATRRETVQPGRDQRQPVRASWPLRAALDLGALPTAPACGRAWTRAILREWLLVGLSEPAELMVSELVTNAMQISRGMTQPAPVRLWLLSDGAQAVILVWDASLEPPLAADASDDAETGRGLLLVEAVSARWGWYSPPEMGGKVVWAVVRSE